MGLKTTSHRPNQVDIAGVLNLRIEKITVFQNRAIIQFFGGQDQTWALKKYGDQGENKTEYIRLKLLEDLYRYNWEIPSAGI